MHLIVMFDIVCTWMLIINQYFVLCEGEEPLSYGYGGTGKASTDCKFKDYGKPFRVGDVVGALLVSRLVVS
jgi:hypothetical protein